MRIIHISILLLCALASAWLTTLVDDGHGTCWTQAVVRNWEQFGVFNLHGKMITNPGGFQVEAQPVQYTGHSPVSLYSVYLCHHWLNAGDVGFLAYYAIMAAVVLLSIRHLLGRTETAFWMAAVVVLTPGYVRWQTSMDPNLAAVLWGFPFCAAVIRLLQLPALKWFHWASLFLLVLVYSSVNWTTTFIHAILFVTLLLLPRVTWRRVVGFAGLAAAVGAIVLLVSLSSRIKIETGSGGGIGLMLRSYGWGNIGYGQDLTTKTALLRLLTINFLGLLPTLLMLGWHFYRRSDARPGGNFIFLLPALVSIGEVLVLRNYFGHHPWMSVHFILIGLILTATVWKARLTPAITSEPPPHRAWQLGFLAATFIYSHTTLTISHTHNGEELRLVALVRQHSPRTATIVINRQTDPQLASLVGRLEMLDRHLVVVPDITLLRQANVPGAWLMLTAVNPAQEKIIAQTSEADTDNSILKAALAWYSQTIAHRRPGDKLEFSQKYYLWQPRP